MVRWTAFILLYINFVHRCIFAQQTTNYLLENGRLVLKSVGSFTFIIHFFRFLSLPGEMAWKRFLSVFFFCFVETSSASLPPTLIRQTELSFWLSYLFYSFCPNLLGFSFELPQRYDHQWWSITPLWFFRSFNAHLILHYV